MPPPSRSLALLAFLLILSLFNIGAYAKDVVPPVKDDFKNAAKNVKSESATTENNPGGVNFNENIPMETERAYASRAIFPDSSSPQFPTLNVGTKTTSLIAYHNYDPTNTFHILLVSGNIMLPEKHTVIQNFSVVRHARVVRPGETVTLEYRFTPNSRLEPGLYDVFLHLHCVNTTDNRTFLVTPFGGEVKIGEALATDPRTILTYFTLIAILLVMVYGIGARLGVKKLISQWKRQKGHPRANVQMEMGTADNHYDPEYISPEHLRYRDAILKRHSVSSNDRKKKQG
ncbi:unnamed protein product [Phytomonas sp. Hart1]|nr:unnamed protein product [Phytomonas sp. Hart1]|eukprot:CCW66272.1 unnamed protein product [Phytomonas sp. isolate Hart1]